MALPMPRHPVVVVFASAWGMALACYIQPPFSVWQVIGSMLATAAFIIWRERRRAR